MKLLSVHEFSHCIAAHHFVGATLGFIHRDPAGGFVVTNNIKHQRIDKTQLVGMMLAGILGEQVISWALKHRTVPQRHDTVGPQMWNLYLAAGPANFMETINGASDAEQISEWLDDGFITSDELGEIIGDLAPALLKGFEGIDFPAMNRAILALEGKDYIELDFSEPVVSWEHVSHYDAAAHG